MRSGAELSLPQEIRPDLFIVPSGETETPKTELVLYAGQSPKRKCFLEYAFPQALVISIPGGTENNSLDSLEIVRNKIDHIKPFVDKYVNKEVKDKTLIAAADVTNYTLIRKSDGVIKNDAQGKPEKTEDIKQVFRNMADDTYFIEASSEIRPVTGKRDGSTTYASIRLWDETRRHLATEKGAKEYLKTLCEFLKSPVYRSNGIKHATLPTEIAGGIDLAVLVRIGAVAEINCVRREAPEFETKLKNTLYLANVGFNPKALENYVPDIDEKIDQWPWLTRVTDFALAKTA